MTGLSGSSPAEEFENIILLSADSLRADRIHQTRNGEPLTPRIDELAADSIEFQPGVAPGPSTRDTMPSMLTGRYPSEFDEYGLPTADTPPRTIAEELSERGFATAALSHNNFTSRRYNIDRGFDYFDDVSEEARKENNRSAWRLYVRDRIEDTPVDRSGRAGKQYCDGVLRSEPLSQKRSGRIHHRPGDRLDARHRRQAILVGTLYGHPPPISVT